MMSAFVRAFCYLQLECFFFTLGTNNYEFEFLLCTKIIKNFSYLDRLLQKDIIENLQSVQNRLGDNKNP